MIARLIKTPATLHRYPTDPPEDLPRDAAGDVVVAFTDVATYAAIQQNIDVQREDRRDGRTIAVTELRCFMRPDGPAPAYRDEVTVAGVRYTFEGDPFLITNPRTGRASHWESKVRRVG